MKDLIKRYNKLKKEGWIQHIDYYEYHNCPYEVVSLNELDLKRAIDKAETIKRLTQKEGKFKPVKIEDTIEWKTDETGNKISVDGSVSIDKNGWIKFY